MPDITFVEPDVSYLTQSLRGFVRSLATCGVYGFWARAEARRQLHRSIRIGGHSLDYTGTGGEAFAAFAVGTLTTIILVGAFLYFYSQSGSGAEQARAVLSDFRWRRLLISLPLMFLLGSAAYRRRKMILRRTWWRGERFDLTGEPYVYALHHLWTAILIPVTLGWAGPWRAWYLERRTVGEMRHGSRSFRALGGPTSLYRAFAVLWFGGGTIYVATMVLLGLTVGEPLLAAIALHDLTPLQAPGVATTALSILGIGLLPVFGVIAYYRAVWLEHQCNSLSLDGMQLRATFPKGQLAALLSGCTLLKLVTLGALSPFADAAVARFLVARLKVVPLPT